jgi:uncharacterized protein
MVNCHYPDTVIQIFCKTPIAGQVKTRLMPTLTAQQAMLVHQALTERLLAFLHKAALCPLQLWCTPTTDHPFFQKWVQKYALTLHLQEEGGLGKKMFQALNSGLSQFSYVLLIGCDCPSWTIYDFEQAIQALKKDADIVLSPTEDGGYSLIGVKQAHTALFNDDGMPWGTHNVLSLTRQRIQQQALTLFETTLQWDIDTPEDLVRYYANTFRS